MKRSEIHKDILCRIGAKLLDDGKMSQDDYDDLEDTIDFTVPVGSRNWFDGIDCGGYEAIIRMLSSVDSILDDPEITAPSYVGSYIVTEKRHKVELKPFAVHDTVSKFGLITGLALSQLNNVSNPSEILNVITNIWAKIKDDGARWNEFLDFCKNPENNGAAA